MPPKVIHQYYKKELEEGSILLQVNPLDFTGIELLVGNEGHIRRTERDFGEDIFEDLQADNFQNSSALEFNLMLNKTP